MWKCLRHNSFTMLYGIKITEKKQKMQKLMRLCCYYPLREEIKHGDVEMIYFDHVGKKTTKNI